MKGELVFESGIQLSYGKFVYQLPDLSMLPSGVYTLEVNDGISRMVSRMPKWRCAPSADPVTTIVLPDLLFEPLFKLSK